jgi:hypothetical protein
MDFASLPYLARVILVYLHLIIKKRILSIISISQWDHSNLLLSQY